ncbi:MAG TPA: ArsR family transcriptional regulator [Chthonomonadaceae bacterium]|nr:ArsR family transcriptional regulator [Chthonomonadaceae bacterium]
MGPFERNRRFFASTRGRILALLRRQSRTVTELAEALELADNTVRAHLATLERDGLVEQRGLRPGLRKPHYAYNLTDAGEALFLEACDPVLDHLLRALAARLPSEAFIGLLHTAGQGIAQEYLRAGEGAALEERIGKALEALTSLGGLVELEAREDGRLFIEGHRCPFSTIAARNPTICELAQALVSAIMGVPVQQQCERGTPPHCHLEILPAEEPPTIAAQ